MLVTFGNEIVMRNQKQFLLNNIVAKQSGSDYMIGNFNVNDPCCLVFRFCVYVQNSDSFSLDGNTVPSVT